MAEANRLMNLIVAVPLLALLALLTVVSVRKVAGPPEMRQQTEQGLGDVRRLHESPVEADHRRTGVVPTTPEGEGRKPDASSVGYERLDDGRFVLRASEGGVDDSLAGVDVAPESDGSGS